MLYLVDKWFFELSDDVIGEEGLTVVQTAAVQQTKNNRHLLTRPACRFFVTDVTEIQVTIV